MEEATELADYLPLSFKTRSEQGCIEFLWDAFETHYARGEIVDANQATTVIAMKYPKMAKRLHGDDFMPEIETVQEKGG